MMRHICFGEVGQRSRFGWEERVGALIDADSLLQRIEMRGKICIIGLLKIVACIFVDKGAHHFERA